MSERAVSIPLLMDHDPAKVIGFAKVEYDRLVVVFSPQSRVTLALLGTMFNYGVTVLEWREQDGERYVLKAEVIEMSVDSRGQP